MKHFTKVNQQYKKDKLIKNLLIGCGTLTAFSITGINFYNNTHTPKYAAQTYTTQVIQFSQNITPTVNDEHSLANFIKTSTTQTEIANMVATSLSSIKQTRDAKLSEIDTAKQEAYHLIKIKNSDAQTGIKSYPEGIVKHKDLIFKYSEMFNVDPYLIAALLSQESGGQQYCVGGASVGLAQIDAALIDEFVQFGRDYFGQTWTADDRYEPAPAIAFCCSRIAMYLDHYDSDYKKALQAYNFSHYSLDALISHFGDDWQQHTAEIAYYNGHYERTGNTKYGDPNYVKNVMRFYSKSM